MCINDTHFTIHEKRTVSNDCLKVKVTADNYENCLPNMKESNYICIWSTWLTCCPQWEDLTLSIQVKGQGHFPGVSLTTYYVELFFTITETRIPLRFVSLRIPGSVSRSNGCAQQVDGSEVGRGYCWCCGFLHRLQEHCCWTTEEVYFVYPIFSWNLVYVVFVHTKIHMQHMGLKFILGVA